MSYQPVMADESLPHQIKLRNRDNTLFVECNCGKLNKPFSPSVPNGTPLDPLVIYNLHLQEVSADADTGSL